MYSINIDPFPFLYIAQPYNFHMACAETFESSFYIVTQSCTIGWQTLLYVSIRNSYCQLNIGFYVCFQQLQLFNSNFFCRNLCGVNVRHKDETEVCGNTNGIQQITTYTVYSTCFKMTCGICKVKMKLIFYQRNVLLLTWPYMNFQNYIQHRIKSIELCCKRMNAAPREPRDESWCFTQRCARWTAADSVYKSGAGLASFATTKTVTMGRVILDIVFIMFFIIKHTFLWRWKIRCCRSSNK